MDAADHSIHLAWPLTRALAALLLLALSSCGSATAPAAGPSGPVFVNPERVTILGYEQDAMEPFLSRDGQTLFFNNSNAPVVDTNLHYAERVDDLTFDYRGEIAGANSTELDGVPSMDSAGGFFFVSTRSYGATLSTVYRGTFADGVVSDVALVDGISPLVAGLVNFDVEVSPDGETLYSVDGEFQPGDTVPRTANFFIARRSGSSFERHPQSATLLAHVNTAALEYAAAISSDGLELYFTRLPDGVHPRIYVAARASASQPFGDPVLIGAIDGFVEAPTLSPDEESLYYHRRDGTRFVLYRVTRAP